MLGMAAMLASCSQSDDLLQSEQTNTSDGLKAVTITATLPEDGMITRSVTADKDDEVDRCLLQVLVENGTDDQGNPVYVPASGDLKDVKEMIPNGTNSYTLSGIYLNDSYNYKFLFWADGGSGYTVTDLKNVTLTDTEAAPGIAWQGSALWSDQSKSATISADLHHAVAKVTLMTTTDLDAGTPVSINIPEVYTAFNVETGNVTGTAIGHGIEYSTTTTNIDVTTEEPNKEVFSFYALVDDDTQDIEIANGQNSNYTSTTETVSGVPLGPNKHTTLQGDVRNLGLKSVKFTATIVTDWDKPGTDPTEFK